MNNILVGVLCLLLVNAQILVFDMEISNRIIQMKSQGLILFIAQDQSQKSIKSYEALQNYDKTNPQMILAVRRKSQSTKMYHMYGIYFGYDYQSPLPYFIMRNKEGAKFLYQTDAITAQGLAQFVSGVKSGNVKQFYRSGPIPKTNDDAVKILVSKQYEQMVLQNQKQVLVYFYLPVCQPCKQANKLFQLIAKKLEVNKNLLFAKIDLSLNQLPGFNFDQVDYPCIYFWKKDKSVAPVMLQKARTANGIINKIKAVTQYPWIKIAPIQEQKQEESNRGDDKVLSVINSNFEDLVLKTQKQVLVQFYAPWCGHCKRLAPIYQQTAKKLAVNPNVILAKVDMTVNKVPGVTISGYPTLKFWKKDKSAAPIDYRGGRRVDQIINWIKQITQYPWVDISDITQSKKQFVNTVNGDTFNQMVLQTQKQVLVKFYAPWCGHCTRMAPDYEQAAKILSVNPNMLLVKIDMTVNKVDGINIKSYPTLKFWKKDKAAAPVDFKGARSTEGIINWIKQNTEYPWVTEKEDQIDLEEL